jgi:hypothetical protein
MFYRQNKWRFVRQAKVYRGIEDREHGEVCKGETSLSRCYPRNT